MPVIDWNDQAVVARVRAAAMQGVVRATELVRNEALRLVMQTEKTGRLYRRGGVTHQASAPGEPPASDTGRLVGSITTFYDQDKLTGIVSANTEYAPFLEYGTAKMEPRPFMRPALANKSEEVTALVNRAIAAELSK